MDAADISKKEAQKAYNRAWYAKNKDFVAAKEWIDRLNSDGKTKRETTVLQTAEERKAKKKAYHETVQKPKMMAAYRAKLAENPNLNREQYAKRAEYHKAWMRQWRIENPELAKAKDASDKVKFADRNRVAMAAWRAANKDKIRSDFRAWSLANPDVVRNHNVNRRAKLKSAEGTHTEKDINSMYLLQKGKCIVCAVSLGKKYDIDHIIPLSKGGSNDVGNLQLLCQHCNRSKHAKDPIAFMQSRGFLL